MSPTIRIDDDVFKALQGKAQPFVDSPNGVLRRLLGLNRSRGPSVPMTRAPIGSATPEATYRTLILACLAKTGGSAPRREVLKKIEEAMNGKFKPRDLQRTGTGAIVWVTYASFERQNMVIDGLLKSNSPRGIWELTEKGSQEARNQP